MYKHIISFWYMYGTTTCHIHPIFIDNYLCIKSNADSRRTYLTFSDKQSKRNNYHK